MNRAIIAPRRQPILIMRALTAAFLGCGLAACLAILPGCSVKEGGDGQGARERPDEEAAAQPEAAAPAPAAKATAQPAPEAGDPHALKGKLLAEVRKRHGNPQGTLVNKGRVVWVYPAFTVYSDNGRTVSSVETTEEYKDVPIVEPAARAAAEASAGAVPSDVEIPDVVVVSDRGRRIDLRPHVTKGKITVVDFFANWCGPCRVMAPRLEDLARDDKDVVLLKINIVSWKTDVVKQYRISSIPNLRVYDRKGVVVGKPTASLEEVKALVAQAKKR